MSNKACRTLGCNKISVTNLKGLCMTCYSKAKKMVESGRTTWEVLESKGLIEGKADPFETAFNKAIGGAPDKV